MLTNDRRSHEDGFALVELLVAIAIMAVVGSVVTVSVVRSMQVSAATTQRVEVLTDLQRAQQRMSRTVRAADPILAATASSLTVQERTGGLSREVTYALVDGAIQRTAVDATGTTATSTVIADLEQDTDITPVFTYTTADGSAWPGGLVESIRRVGITLVGGFDGSDPITLSTSVFPRNTVLEGDQ